MINSTLSKMHAVILINYKNGSRILDEREVISDLVSRSRPTHSDYQAAKHRPEVVVGQIIYPPSDPNPSGPQYNPVDPAQMQLDRFL